MSARTKLIGITLAGVLLFAALLGGVTNSWLIFAVAAILGTGVMIHAGEMRLRPVNPHSVPHNNLKRH